MNSMKKVDIIIIGGGMVGLTMAAAIIDSGLKVLVVEQGDFKAIENSNLLIDEIPLDSEINSRVSAISPGNQNYLTQLGIWDSIPNSRLGNYEKMHVWDANGTGKITFDAAETAASHLGTIVENEAIRAAALKRLSTTQNIECINGCMIKEIHSNERYLDVELSSKEVIRAQLLVGADGAHSTVRKLCSMTYQQQTYSQRAFVANVKTSLPHENTAWQCFTQTGPVAFLPLFSDNLCSIVWSLDEDKAKNVSQLNHENFAFQLAKAFENKLGDLELISDFQSFPLIKRHSDRYLFNRCVLVGDAAHTIHPLAGQGANLGFQDVELLSQIICKLNRQQRDFGLIANLRPYERERKSKNMIMQEAMSGFKWLFGHSGFAPVMLRNLGLSQIDRFQWIKQSIIRHAMGI